MLVLCLNTCNGAIHGELKAIHSARKLVKLFKRENLCIIEEEETYSKKDFSQLPGHQYYYHSKGVSNEFKYIQTEKFIPKILVWQAICSQSCSHCVMYGVFANVNLLRLRV